jgi:hypothetical protein
VAAFSILISMTLAISGNIVFFQQANPGLLEWFARLGK